MPLKEKGQAATHGISLPGDARQLYRIGSQWPDKVGKGLMFISLDVSVLDALRVELEGRSVDVKDGQWGYRLMVIADPDGNELYFPYPTSLATSPLITSNAERPSRRASPQGYGSLVGGRD
jgi:hypothetical protein